jgi:hypothetical protein
MDTTVEWFDDIPTTVRLATGSSAVRGDRFPYPFLELIDQFDLYTNHTSFLLPDK